MALLAMTFIAGVSHAGIEWCPGIDAGVGLMFYTGQDGPVEEFRFITEQTVNLDVSVLKHGCTTWHLDVDLAIGMGESVAANMPFSPIDFRSRFAVYAEQAREHVTWRVGWNHGCDHLIYKDEGTPWYEQPGVIDEPDVYYNRIFVVAGTHTMRPQARIKAWHSGDTPETVLEKIILSAELGYYARSVPGLFEEAEVSGGHDWQWDIILNAGYPLLMGDRHSLVLHNELTVLVEDDTDTVLRDRVELELYIRLGSFGGSLFVAANPVDEHPRDSVEGLWELGARWIY